MSKVTRRGWKTMHVIHNWGQVTRFFIFDNQIPVIKGIQTVSRNSKRFEFASIKLKPLKSLTNTIFIFIWSHFRYSTQKLLFHHFHSNKNYFLINNLPMFFKTEVSCPLYILYIKHESTSIQKSLKVIVVNFKTDRHHLSLLSPWFTLFPITNAPQRTQFNFKYSFTTSWLAFYLFFRHIFRKNHSKHL